jgi:cytochrome c oxidase subunit 1
MTGVMVAVPPADYQYHDNYFVVAHFHYVLVGGTILGLFAGIYYWWPKMFGKMLNETLGKIHFWTFIIGMHLTFFPQHFVGLFGMQRRVFTYRDGVLAPPNLVSTIGTIGMVIGSLALIYNLYRTFKKGSPAPADPWNGRTLEWAIPSPPPVYNFAQLPRVRGLDAFWLEKQEGKQEMYPAEPLSSIHMRQGQLYTGDPGFTLRRDPYVCSFIPGRSRLPH